MIFFKRGKTRPGFLRKLIVLWFSSVGCPDLQRHPLPLDPRMVCMKTKILIYCTVFVFQHNPDDDLETLISNVGFQYYHLLARKFDLDPSLQKSGKHLSTLPTLLCDTYKKKHYIRQYIDVALITMLLTFKIKIVTFKGGHLMW